MGRHRRGTVRSARILAEQIPRSGAARGIRARWARRPSLTACPSPRAANPGRALVTAARHLRRSPPSITRALSALENRVGARLVERTTRRLPGRGWAGARGELASAAQRIRGCGAGNPARSRTLCEDRPL
ncbi:MAG: helix-turn-helix domain-containing protein [Steroidobacteraceae bacterium]